MAEPTDGERRVLEALAALETDGDVQSVQAVAIRTGGNFTAAYAAINTLFAEGLLTAGLRLTDAGRKLVT